MATSKRATAAELAERQGFIHQLLDLGISRATILAQVQKRFGISRAQAYRELAKVADDRQKDDLQIAPPKGTEAMKEAIGILHSAMVDCAVDGDLKELPKISREMREMCRSLGIGAALGGAQPNGSESVGESPQAEIPPEVVAATTAAKRSH